MFWRKSTNCCESTDCCDSASTSTFSSLCESCLDLEITADDDEDICSGPRQHSGKLHDSGQQKYNLIRRDIIPVRTESKHRVEIKIIGKKKPKKLEDQKLLHDQPKSRTALNDFAEKAVSALTNCIPHIFSSTSKAKDVNRTTYIKGTQQAEQKDSEIIEKRSNKTYANKTEENNQYDDRAPTSADDNETGNKPEEINELIQKFKSEASEADDDLFEKLFERLKNELELLSCECAGTTVIPEDTSFHFPEDDEADLDLDNDNEGTDENNDGISNLPDTSNASMRDIHLSIQKMEQDEENEDNEGAEKLPANDDDNERDDKLSIQEENQEIDNKEAEEKNTIGDDNDGDDKLSTQKLRQEIDNNDTEENIEENTNLPATRKDDKSNDELSKQKSDNKEAEEKLGGNTKLSVTVDDNNGDDIFSIQEIKQESDYKDAQKNTEKISGLPEIRHDSLRDDFLTMKEMRDMFAELKYLLDKNFSGGEGRRNDEKIAENFKKSTEIEIITACLGGNKDECECKNRKINDEIPISKTENDSTEKDSADNIPIKPGDFYDEIAKKMKEVACQCHSSKTGSLKEINSFSENNDFTENNHPKILQSNNHDTNQNHDKQNIENLVGGEEKLRVEETVDYDYETKYVEKIEGKLLEKEESGEFIPLSQFINLAAELKEAFHNSSCKCRRNKTKRNDSEGKIGSTATMSSDKGPLNFTKETLQDSGKVVSPHADKEPQLKKDSLSGVSSVQGLVIDPIEKSANSSSFQPLTTNKLSNVMKKPFSPQVADSPIDSFYSAKCSNLQTLGATITKKDEGVGANTPCKCHTDIIVQKLQDMKLSYGVFCDGQLPVSTEKSNQQNNSDIEIRRKISEGGDVEKIRVRIRLEGDELNVEPEEMGKSNKFIKAHKDYDIKYETIQQHIDEPKVLKVGNQIKIYIPLDI